jgi:ABC-type sugar transport system substrate-binding protein
VKFIFLLLLILSGCAAQYEKYAPVASLPPAFNKEIINRFLLTQYKYVLNEQSRALYYRDNLYISDEIIAEGSSATVTANGLKIVINCILKKCNQVIIAHPDLDNSEKFKAMMQQANIRGFYVITGDSDVNWID